MTPSAALQRLLDGTGLRARFQDRDDVVLEPITNMVQPAPQPQAPPGAPTLALDTLRVQASPMIQVDRPPGFNPGFYRTLLQNELRQALSRDPETSTGAYSAVLRLWPAPSGALQRVEIAESTGNLPLDRAIRRVLLGAVLQALPPPGMPLPITVRVDVRAAH